MIPLLSFEILVNVCISPLPGLANRLRFISHRYFCFP
jgi:hypothetical protein